ncbi:type II secretion system F family protein, partial [Salmonella enterica]|uniref:type II secretion system F family protein n=1 Tax=Salmonella enterica TaxID=28901 RepID=UPI0032B3986F
EADNESLVLTRLRDQSLQVVDIKELRKGKAMTFGKQKIKAKTLVIFSRQFATMIDAGIPILRCLEILSSQTKDPVMKPVLDQISLDVKSGA